MGLLLAGAGFVANPALTAIVDNGDQPSVASLPGEIVATARRTREDLQSIPAARTTLWA